MKQGSSGSLLSTVFVDYDNIYLSLKRKNEDAAKKFAKDSSSWISAIESGELLTTTNGQPLETKRRLVMNRCYGNPVPRRNNHDNATDMNSFPFVRHHFLRSGFEVIDCPPLTAQLKNSADIRMVMDIRDLLTHDTYFDEFIILSGDADFTPVLHRLRAHARRTVIYANDYTAAPYTAICDGEIRESDLIRLLVEGKLPGEKGSEITAKKKPTAAEFAEIRREIIAEVTHTARSAGQPIPLESLADRAVRTLGHDKTVGSGWGGAGSFRELLATNLNGDIRLSDQPPYFVYDAGREANANQQHATHATPAPANQAAPRLETPVPSEPVLQPLPDMSANQHQHTGAPQYGQGQVTAPSHAPNMGFSNPAPHQTATSQTNAPQFGHPAQQPTPADTQLSGNNGLTGAAPLDQMSQAGQQNTGEGIPQSGWASEPSQPTDATANTGQINDVATDIQQSIARIHEACQAPPLSPPEYRLMFDAIADEISANELAGQQTLDNISVRLRDSGLNAEMDDIRFIFNVISESDPWFQQGKTANLFAGRFRNFVIARCRSQGLGLTAQEIDLIDAWFLAPIQSNNAQQNASSQQMPMQEQATGTLGMPMSRPHGGSTMDTTPMNQGAGTSHGHTQHQGDAANPHSGQSQSSIATSQQDTGNRWWNQGGSGEQPSNDGSSAASSGDEFPRIVRGRTRF